MHLQAEQQPKPSNPHRPTSTDFPGVTRPTSILDRGRTAPVRRPGAHAVSSEVVFER